MRVKWLAMPVAAVALGAGVGALTVHWRAPAAGPQNRPAAAAIANPEVTLTGRIRPQQVVRVAPAVSGPVEALLVEVGQDVYQGEVLARVGAAGLESVRDAALQVVERAQDDVSKSEAQIVSARLEASRADAGAQGAQIALERAQRVYDRQKVLHEAGATPRLVYEKAERDYQSSQQEYGAAERAVRAAADAVEAANAGLASARKVLADRTAESETAQLAFAAAEVRSPVDGFLAASNAEVGKSVEEGGAMFEIATGPGGHPKGHPEELEVAVEAPPDVLKRIRPGQAALVVVADVADSGLAGVVREIKDNQAIVEFHSTLSSIKPGMQAGVRLKLE
ncbi:MAG: HlyD family secretion protein [Bryobacteraceae bacterium]